MGPKRLSDDVPQNSTDDPRPHPRNLNDFPSHLPTNGIDRSAGGTSREIRRNSQNGDASLFDAGAPAAQVASAMSAATDSLLLELWESAQIPMTVADRQLLADHSAVIAVGGSGRGDVAPYSDTDILFLHETRIVPDCSRR